ncbi:MAG: DNRLRE domain-containing protein [Synechococcales cyanobacterium RM1_1_8]|nr:DNRLRE domain-containing protein [Synechococcales cyanobacterium RM1_1_8]
MIINSFDDAYVDSGARNKNYGSATTLRIDNSPRVYEIYMRPLGIDAIPPNTTIEHAVLRLQAHNGGDAAEVRQVTGAWAENTIKYNNKPGSGGVVSQFPTTAGVVEIDVTAIVQAWADGAPAHGVRLRSNGSNGSDFYSSENASSRPELHVWYAQ